MQRLFEQAHRPLTLDQELILATDRLIKVLPDDLYKGPSLQADPNEHGNARYSKAEYAGYDDSREIFEVGVDEAGPYVCIGLPDKNVGSVAISTNYVIELGDPNSDEPGKADIETREYHSVEAADDFDASVKGLLDEAAQLSPQYVEELRIALEAARNTWNRNREATVSLPRKMTHQEKLGLLAILNTKHAEYVSEEREEPEEA